MGATAEDTSICNDVDQKTEVGPVRRLVASISRQGVGIGQCLFEALQSLDDPSTGGDEADEPDAKRQKIDIDSEAIDRIVQTFGEAVADTQLESAADASTIYAGAPRALLRGRLDHYNRVGQSWRILINDVKLKEGLPLPSDRRKRDRTPLWESTGDEQQEIAIDGKVQILTYNDV